MKYIDVEKLIAEIKRRIAAYQKNFDKADNKIAKLSTDGRIASLKGILPFITSLQQETNNWDEEYREDDLRTRFAFYTYKDEDSILYLSNVFVEETSRNKGFGTKILQAAEKIAKTIGAITIRLKVKQNSPANDWYRKHGYGYLTFEGEYDWLEKNLEYLKPKQVQPEVDLGNYISNKLKELGADLLNHKPYSFNRGLNVGKTKAYDDILKRLNARKEDK